MADKGHDTREEGSSSRDRQGVPPVFEVGESSRPPLAMPFMDVNAQPIQGFMTGLLQEDAFRTQLIAAMNVFAGLAQNPRFMEYLQAPTMSQQTRQVTEPVEPAQVPCASQQGREHSHVAESIGAPR